MSGHQIRPGQLWSVHTQGTRRYVRIVSLQSGANDPDEPAAKVTAENVDTLRRSHPLASTVRGYWRLEREAGT